MSVNAGQTEFWNGDPGRRWVDLDADLEHMHAEVAEAVLDGAAPAAGERVLDIGCGSGAVARAAARAVGERGTVTGLDVSAPLLDLARQKAMAEGLDNAGFAEADAQVFDFEDAAYDLALSRFGVMFFDDPVAAFGNILRAMAPGGRLVMAAWSHPERNPWFAEAKAAAVARLGPGAPADPDAPGPMAFRDPDRVGGILRDAGWQAAEAATRTVTLHHPEGWTAAERLLPKIGPIAGLMREKEGGPDDLAAILADMKARWRSHIGPEGLRLPAEIRLYTARAPG